MTSATKTASEPTTLFEQPHHVLGLSIVERNSLIVSMRKVGKTWVVVSRYGDDVWWLSGFTTNTIKAEMKMDFLAIPAEFRDSLKAIIYRLMLRGRTGHKPPRARHLSKTFAVMGLFLEYLQSIRISSLTNVSPLACAHYAATCKTRTGRSLAPSTLRIRLNAVETLYELSQYSDTPMPEYPWAGSTVRQMVEDERGQAEPRKTPLMPDNVFTTLFQSAWDVLQEADKLLDLRDEMARIIAENAGVSLKGAKAKANKRLREFGFSGGSRKLESELLEIRTAAYIVIASVSGCRNHELAYLCTNAYYSTEDDDGNLYWWMRSKSTKTDEGLTEWMVPEAAVTALKVMERWSAPFRTLLFREIEQLRALNPLDSLIAEAEEHLDALFLGVDKSKGNIIRTIGVRQWNRKLRAYVGRCGLAWNLASHQFRRKFANYAAKSQFGDLRYLRKHFKHWSMNMTLGYALNESQEMALYIEIQDELGNLKEATVSGWLDSDTPLAGGYGLSLVDWRSKEESVVLFKNHAHMVKSIAASTAIRSNGHAWCTADDNLCVGNTLERTRCGGGCGNAVIGPVHAVLYQGLYDHLSTLRDADDIGRGGRARIERDLERCANVLRTLGYSPTGTPG
ncbi:hypothetical protein [Burkholderia cepacia]|uniref:hypothetical protein n=1 Tax=Burkholderia cepacia TaxID=292 RepID=UPI002AB46276|nr:hypothetical protein [Burkholderia cepacia]HEM8511389.1 hypothetical protein [Burkholderia cepacia]